MTATSAGSTGDSVVSAPNQGTSKGNRRVKAGKRTDAMLRKVPRSEAPTLRATIYTIYTHMLLLYQRLLLLALRALLLHRL